MANDPNSDTVEIAPEKPRYFLKKNEGALELPLDRPTTFTFPHGTLDVTPAPDASTVSAVYHYDVGGKPQTVECTDHDLSTPLTLGRGTGKGRTNVMQLPPIKELERVSGNQATIELNNGKLYYQHEATNHIRNPLVPLPPEITGPIPREGGTGGGYTNENRHNGNTRVPNEDAGIVTAAPALNDEQALKFMERMHIEHIIPSTENMKGGTTLTAMMHTTDGHYACSQVGDANVYAITQNQQTQDIRLIQLSIPHNRMGGSLRDALSELPDALLPATRDIQAAIDAIEPRHPDLAELLRSDQPTKIQKNSVYIYRNLGKGQPQGSPDGDPDIFLIDPAAQCPPGSEFKGMMVACDGLDLAIHRKNEAVQKALKPLYANGATPDPQLVAEAAVNAAVPYSGDNLTAAVLNGEGLVAVADGNTETHLVAQQAVQCIREACQAASQSPTESGVFRAITELGQKHARD